ncbi:unnamed protein product [Urochloa humidicola]
MASLQLGNKYTGSSSSRRKVHGRSGGRSRSAAAVKRLLLKLRSTWSRRAARPRRAAVSFGYDLQSYSLNFDDGLYSSGHRRL